ncbi:MAG: UDP-N-acetylmuramoyl-tripeptide--D-alanyl-D-alanine ligase [Bifidobacteriaceae bacterium]|jgi:UDP-N-acetylmuramoyl-tripeptide--D-alanyl-D-alanine ligase|nr:UDP-N-acetylmuramoyl-tripeptide--D-alanyl-D-alanine ligase [Bifidobacteriaceae bacterium]
MIPWNPVGLATATGARLSPEVDCGAILTDVVIDSRLAGPGKVFVALPGSRVDGLGFVPEAVAKGSPLAVVGRLVDGPTALVDDPVAALGHVAEMALRRARVASGQMKVIGVTGSVGKTTTKDLIARICAQFGRTVAAEQSFNNHIGLPLTVVRADRETRFMVVEMGANHEGEIAALTRIAPPDVAVVLGVGRAHLGEFGSRQAIARAKGEMVAGMMPNGSAALNMDDPLVRGMAFGVSENVVTFGYEEMARIRGLKRRLGPDGRLRLTAMDQDIGRAIRIETGLVGLHQGLNVLGALAAAVAAGIEFPQAVAAVQGAEAASPHRMAVHHLSGGAILLDDSYNANPESMRAAIQTAAKMGKRGGRKVIAVLGEMRELGRATSAELLRVGRAVADHHIARLIVAGEPARAIGVGAATHGMASEDIEFWPQTDGLADHLRSIADHGLILIKASNGAQLWKLADSLTGEDAEC